VVWPETYLSGAGEPSAAIQRFFRLDGRTVRLEVPGPTDDFGRTMAVRIEGI
jgi:hypothetical protein